MEPDDEIDTLMLAINKLSNKPVIFSHGIHRNGVYSEYDVIGHALHDIVVSNKFKCEILTTQWLWDKGYARFIQQNDKQLLTLCGHRVYARRNRDKPWRIVSR